MGLYNEVYIDYPLPLPEEIKSKFENPLQTLAKPTVILQTKDLTDYPDLTSIEIDMDGSIIANNTGGPYSDEISAYLIWEGHFLQWILWFIDDVIHDVDFDHCINLLKSERHDLVV